MLTAGSVLRWACIGLWSETMALMKANLAWFAASLPLAVPLLILFVSVLPSSVTGEQRDDLTTPLMLTGLLLLILPNPASLGLHATAAVMTRKDSPTWSQFTGGVRGNISLGLKLFGVGFLATMVFLINIAFYLRVQPEALRLLAIVCGYLLLYWLGMQLYLGPLVVLLGERQLTRLYRRSAMLVLGNPLLTLALLVALLLLILISLLAPPLYLLFAMAFSALIGTGALDQLRRKFDPTSQTDGEPV